MQRILVTQSRLYEHVHTESMELKPLGFKIKKEGINTQKFYCNPYFLLLPFKECDTLSKLTTEQMSVISAIYYGSTYAEIASSETIALTYNLVAAEKVFDIYSDDYMILFHETAEETDHIITFHNVCKGLLGTGEALGPRHFNHLKPVYESFKIFEPKLCNYGFASMYLLMRYLLNLALKQLESFMAQGIADEKIHSTSQAIISGHAADEARHTTTSLQLGMALYERASKTSQSFLRSLLKRSIYSMIDRRFSPPTEQYQYSIAQQVLAKAFTYPEFDGIGITHSELEGAWNKHGVIITPSREYENSQRWIAQQIQRLVNHLDIKIKTNNRNIENYTSLLRTG